MPGEQDDQSLMERLCIAVCIVTIGVGAAFVLKHGKNAAAQVQAVKSEFRALADTGSHQ
jgi:hypothetical protein